MNGTAFDYQFGPRSRHPSAFGRPVFRSPEIGFRATTPHPFHSLHRAASHPSNQNSLLIYLSIFIIMVSEEPVASADGLDGSDIAKVHILVSFSRRSPSDFVQALQELAKGERTATALENQLSSMEAKIDALLAQAEKDAEEVKKTAALKSSESTTTEEAKDSSKTHP